jgi:hypothetical protein
MAFKKMRLFAAAAPGIAPNLHYGNVPAGDFYENILQVES